MFKKREVFEKKNERCLKKNEKCLKKKMRSTVIETKMRSV